MKIELEERIKAEKDSIIIYKLGSLKYTEREIVGVEKNVIDNLL